MPSPEGASRPITGFRKGAVVYAITPPEFEMVSFLPLVERALATGKVAALQLRLKPFSVDKMNRCIAPLRELTHKYQLPLIANDAPHPLADGVHLGKGDWGKGNWGKGNWGKGDWSELYGSKEALEKQAKKRGYIVGVSCANSIQYAKEITAKEVKTSRQVSYVSFGSFYPSTTKPEAVHCPITVLQEWRRLNSPIPAVAIGGINAHNGKGLLEAGASCVALCSALWQDPEGVIEALAGS